MIAYRHIKNIVAKSFYCSVASVRNDIPHCSPIGSVYMLNAQQGYYLEMFTQSAKKAQLGNSMGCILVVNTSLLFWLKSLFKGYFESPPAVRLIIKFGEKRESTPTEQDNFRRRVKLFRRLKGYKIMWSKPSHVREFSVEKVIPVSLGKMTAVDYSQ